MYSSFYWVGPISVENVTLHKMFHCIKIEYLCIIHSLLTTQMLCLYLQGQGQYYHTQTLSYQNGRMGSTPQQTH